MKGMIWVKDGITNCTMPIYKSDNYFVRRRDPTGLEWTNAVRMGPREGR
jgi:ribosomal protein L24E